MVSQITDGGSAVDRKGRPFRRRNVFPALGLIAALGIGSAGLWAVALTDTPEVAAPAPCNPPPPPADPAAPAFLGDEVTPTTMVDVAPAPLVDTRVRVLNAGGQGGKAAEVAGALRERGFAPPEAANDPVYGATRLTCSGQIRFGTAGQAAAATVWLVAPCLELVSDGRPDDTVDLVLGSDFETLSTTADSDLALTGLQPGAASPPDADLVQRVHSAEC